MYTYAYSVMAATFLAVWVLMYLGFPRTRTAMFWTSLVFGTAGPVGEFWLVPAYWRPVYLLEFGGGSWRFGIEDYVVTFAFAGVAAALFEHAALKSGFEPLPNTTRVATLVRMTSWGALGLVLISLLSDGGGMHPIHSCLVAVTVTALIMLSRKPGILRLSALLAVGAGILFWGFYVWYFRPLFPGVIEALWNLEASVGSVYGVPVEEMIWAASTMLFAGPVFRACRGTAEGS